MAGSGYAFDERGARRVVDATRYVESLPRSGPADERGSPGRTDWRLAVVTTAITAPASSSAAAGSGYARLRRYDKATNTFVDLPGVPVKVVNPWPGTSTTATVGKVIMVYFVDGVWMLAMENCT